MATVLIIDDEPAIGDYLARLINRMGHLAQTAQTAADAFAKIDAASFNLIIADIRLPDAPDALQWIRDIADKCAGVPLVLISGAPSSELDECAKGHGVLAFLSKPFELTFIRNILQKVCDGENKAGD